MQTSHNIAPFLNFLVTKMRSDNDYALAFCLNSMVIKLGGLRDLSFTKNEDVQIWAGGPSLLAKTCVTQALMK